MIYGTILWFQALPSEEEGHQTTVGKTPANSLLNQFKNITACEQQCIIMSCTHKVSSLLSISERFGSLFCWFFNNIMLELCLLRHLKLCNFLTHRCTWDYTWASINVMENSIYLMKNSMQTGSQAFIYTCITDYDGTLTISL